MGRPRYRRLPHTADVRLAVWGSDAHELAANAVAGALAVALESAPRGEPARRHALSPLPRDPAMRLVRVVNEALYLLYVRREVVVTVSLHGGRAWLGVAPLPADRAPAVEVKAATCHALEVERGARFRVVLTLDL